MAARAVKTGYLALYNAACAAGWAYVLALTAAHFSAGRPASELYAAVSGPLKVVQTAALLEVVHAATGLVRSAVATTALQVASRLVVLWGIVHVAPPAQVGPFFTLMTLSWGAVEVPRYGYYLVSLAGTPPAALTWLRYSLFIVLYPTGITGEVGSLWTSLPFIRAHRVGEWALPNAHNVAFSWYLSLWAALVVVYPVGSYIMYSHMLKQRRKMLGGVAKGKAE